MNNPKRRLLLLGALTLLMAPLGWLIAGLPTLSTFFEIDSIAVIPICYGLCLGATFGIFLDFYSENDDDAPIIQNQLELIKNLRLNVLDCILLSFCAGFGEEFLFRQGIQPWLGPWITSVLFVAVHGYLHPKKWNVTKYGLMVLFLILLLSLGKAKFGIWFCVAGHFAYDFVLFFLWRDQNSEV